MANKKGKSHDEEEYQNRIKFYKDALENAGKLLPDSKGVRIKDQLAKREEITNKGLNQDIDLKKITLFVLFGFLAIETIAVFVIAFFQGFNFFGFAIEEWSFKLLIVATIVQISYMLRFAVQHLFPNK